MNNTTCEKHHGFDLNGATLILCVSSALINLICVVYFDYFKVKLTLKGNLLLATFYTLLLLTESIIIIIYYDTCYISLDTSIWFMLTCYNIYLIITSFKQNIVDNGYQQLP